MQRVRLNSPLVFIGWNWHDLDYDWIVTPIFALKDFRMQVCSMLLLGRFQTRILVGKNMQLLVLLMESHQ